MHPIKHLNAPIPVDIRQRRPPAVINDNRTHGPVQAAALGAFATCAPWRVYGADKKDAGIGLRWQLHRDFTDAQVGLDFGQPLAHRHKVTGGASAVQRDDAGRIACPLIHNAAVTALISV